MEAILWSAGIVLFGLGYIASSMETRIRIKRIRLQYNTETNERHYEAYLSGWNSAMSDPKTVNAAYKRHFKNPS